MPAPTPTAETIQRTVAILKSGVVDGMAYTLYADGSIEAQLPQGTVRFGSISELRAHIENNSYAFLPSPWRIRRPAPSRRDVRL